MAIREFEEDMDIIAKLSDTPNDVMTAAELKSKFDEAGVLIKEYLNDVIVPAINGGSIPESEVEEEGYKAHRTPDGVVVLNIFCKFEPIDDTDVLIMIPEGFLPSDEVFGTGWVKDGVELSAPCLFDLMPGGELSVRCPGMEGSAVTVYGTLVYVSEG